MCRKIATKNCLRFVNSVAGTVIDVKNHYTKLHLHMDKEQSKDTATWFPQPTYFTGGEGKGYGAMPERGEVLYLHFPGSNEEINYVISSDGSDYDSIAKRIQASTQNPEPPESKKKPNNRAAAVPKKTGTRDKRLMRIPYTEVSSGFRRATNLCCWMIIRSSCTLRTELPRSRCWMVRELSSAVQEVWN